MITNPVNHLCVHDNRIESDEVRHEQPNFVAFVENVERRLLPEGDFSQPELDDQRIFVWLLNYSMTKLLTHARSARCGCRDEFCVLQWEFPHFDRDLLHAESFQQIQRELIGKRLD